MKVRLPCAVLVVLAACSSSEQPAGGSGGGSADGAGGTGSGSTGGAQAGWGGSGAAGGGQLGCEGAPDGQCSEAELTSDTVCACADCASSAYCNPGQCVDDGACSQDDACTCADCDSDGFCSTNCDEDGACDEYLEGCACADCAEIANCRDNETGAPLASGCVEDADCSSGHCISATSGEIDGGSPQGGLCTLPCQAHEDCVGLDDQGAYCHELADGEGYCLLRCPRGSDQPKSAKCWGRNELGCHRVESKDLCLPACVSDAACGPGMFCNFGTGLCQASPMSDGAPIGTSCSLAQAGQCATGLCAGRLNVADGFSNNALQCTGYCTLGSTAPNCGGAGGIGVCLNSYSVLGYGTLGPGDMGQCVPLCDCGDQCRSSACAEMTSTGESIYGRPGWCFPAYLSGFGFLDEECACIPDCGVNECGPDGCGGSCGNCDPGDSCLDGTCCTPDCSNAECGPNGCGGSCGSCGPNELCAAGTCQCMTGACGGDCGPCASPDVCTGGFCCTPDCANKACGDDGCGGSCGSCGPGGVCQPNQQCCTTDSPCTWDSDCCGNLCNIVTEACVGCYPLGYPFCSDNSECCSGLCDDNGCASCLSDFEDCSSGAQCCSNFCGPNGYCTVP